MNETSKHDLSTNNVINVFHSGGTLAAVQIWTDFNEALPSKRKERNEGILLCVH